MAFAAVFAELYALFKQATVGDCNTSRPGIFDQKGRYKWDAWEKKKVRLRLIWHCIIQNCIREYVLICAPLSVLAPYTSAYTRAYSSSAV